MEFTYTTKNLGNNKTELTLNGNIDEASEFPLKMDLSNTSKLFVDFENVAFINSGGIKKWVLFSRYMDEFPNLEVIFKNCHRIIIDQINLVDGILPLRGTVESLYVPIYCTKCEKSFEVFQTTEQVLSGIDSLKTRLTLDTPQKGHTCKKGLELDIFPELYFKFLQPS